jgi:hypothetical protein
MVDNTSEIQKFDIDKNVKIEKPNLTADVIIMKGGSKQKEKYFLTTKYISFIEYSSVIQCLGFWSNTIQYNIPEGQAIKLVFIPLHNIEYIERLTYKNKMAQK